MAVLLVYPLAYEGIQCAKSGPLDYFSDIYNYSDLFSIAGGGVHIWFAVREGPFHFHARLTLILAFFGASIK